MTQQKRVPITHRSVVQRVNRYFAKHAKEKGTPLFALKNTRGRGGGQWNLINETKGVVTGPGVDPEEIARDAKLLKPWEVVVD